MPDSEKVHPPSSPLTFEVADFLLDRQARNVSPRTLRWHKDALAQWSAYCLAAGVTTASATTPRHLRQWLVNLVAAGHNPGGVSNLYRSIRAFLRWYETEYDPAGWVNPARRVQAPRVPEEHLDPIPLAHVRALLDTCRTHSRTAARDRAILYMLIDTGLRRNELLALRVADVDMDSGAVVVRAGKGRKPRTVFAGAKTRRALLAYYRQRPEMLPTDYIWQTSTGARLSAGGIRQMLARRAAAAGIPTPGVHAFRRAFAVNSLRNGMDVITLQRLLGHAGLSIINRYLKLATADLQRAHDLYGVADSL